MLKKVTLKMGGPERLIKITAACSVLLFVLCVYFVQTYTAECYVTECAGHRVGYGHYNIDYKGMMMIFGMFGLVVLIAGGFAATSVYVNYQKALLEQEATAKGNAFRVLNHELRTPLNGIIGISQLLRSTDMKPNESMLIALETSARHLGLLVSNVLTESMYVNGESLAPNPRMGLVRETLEEVAGILQDMAIARGVDVEILVDCDPTLEIPYDAVILKQVMLNLGGNAVKHTKQGTVTLACDVEDDNLVLAVRDTGGGIPKEKINQLFKAYQQLESYTHKRSHDGIGLGLSVTNKIVQTMGGRIEVHSVLGAGTEFEITCPMSNH